MKQAALFALLLGIAGCTSFEHPLIGKTEAAFDERLAGQWEGDAPEQGKIQLVIRRDGHVDLTSIDPDSGIEKDSFQVATARVAGFDIVNVAVVNDGKTHWQPLRYELSGRDELRVYLSNDETWYDAVKGGTVEGNATRGFEGPSTYVTAPSAKLADFVGKHRDTVFIAKPVVLRRMR